jgi:hypothetical protein
MGGMLDPATSRKLAEKAVREVNVIHRRRLAVIAGAALIFLPTVCHSLSKLSRPPETATDTSAEDIDNEPSLKSGIYLADPMLSGPLNCQSSVLSITNPEAAASATAFEVTEHGCIRAKIPAIDLFVKFNSTWVPYPMTAHQKFKLAVDDVIDPFNLLTIAGLSAIDASINSHSVYGPGMEGFGKLTGVAMTQDITGEFVGTFLICTVAHEDPHYHRMPQASLHARIGHVLSQVLVTQSDLGKPMFNYEDTVGYVIEDKISSLYVPGLHSDMKSTAARVSLGLATAPIGNAISEFLPDISKRVNIHAIFLQRIINQVASDSGGSGP